MPPRRSARVAAAAQRASAGAEPARTLLSSLPPPVAAKVFALVPVDTRLRCREVCRAWRAVLDDPGNWSRLDLREESVAVTFGHLAFAAQDLAWSALLQAALTRARGSLRELLTGPFEEMRKHIQDAEILRVAAENAGTLRVLHISTELHQDTVVEFLNAAPQLEALEAEVLVFDYATAHQMLRNIPPYGPLRIHSLCLYASPEEDAAAAIRALAADVAIHTALQQLTLAGEEVVAVPSSTWLDAMVDAAVTRRLHSVTFLALDFIPESALALARLIGGGALTKLFINRSTSFIAEPGSAALCAALRASTCFIDLTLRNTRFWSDSGAGAAVIRALVSHPSLESLSMQFETPNDDAGKAVAGAALGVLVAANSPALRNLSLFQCQLSDVGLAPVFAALPLNTHLRELNCQYSGISEAFVHDAVLPAVRANVGLRRLSLYPGVEWPDARLAQRIVAIRAYQG